MKREDLLAACEDLIKSYNPLTTTIDAHAYDKLGDSNHPDKQFLKQVLYGCVRYKELLKIFLSNFYHDNSGKSSRNDYTRFLIYSYLAFFRLEELGFKHFEAFAMIHDPTTLAVFLRYLFDTKKLKGSIRGEWVRVVDQEFITNTMIGGIERSMKDCQDLLKRLEAKVFGLAAESDSKTSPRLIVPRSKPPTIPQGPNITKPKPRQIPEPMKIEQKVVVNPIQDLNKVTLADLQEQAEKRKLQHKELTIKKFQESPQQPFKFQEIKSNLEEIRAKVEAERDSHLQFDGFKAKPAPKFSANADTNIKLNIAAILREDALYKKKQEQEAKLIQAYEADLRDSTEFYRWQTRMLQQDEAHAKAEVERRRLEMVKSQQEAIEASLRAKRENQSVAKEMRQVSKEIEQQRVLEKNALTEKNKEVVEEIKQIRETAPREAMDKIVQANQVKRQELNEQLAIERERKKKQDELEQKQREDLIRQIRALDRVHREHVAVFDPTQTSNVGLLEEMSLVELRERLQIQKVKERELEQERREEIIAKKQKKEESLRARIGTISRARQAASEANRNARKRRKQAAVDKAKAEQEERNRGNLLLAQKLAKQRAERDAETLRLQQEEEQIAKQRMFLGAAKSMIEEKHFEELLLGAERQANQRQTQAQQAALIYEQVQERAKQQWTKNLKQQRVAKHRALEKQNEMVDKATIEMKQQLREDANTRREFLDREHQHQTLAREFHEKRNAYATMQSKRNIARGKLVLSKRNAVT